ncbi:MAG: fused MFS/spermidine synthase, partial [Frankiaceae bacterium]|nr:fused MFS/spermidine synthase [Frankiaceae bacterium]
LDDPGYLEFEYVQRIGEVLDAMAPAAPARLAVTHLGGGAGTLARYIAHTRPGSPQIICEPDAALTELVRARLPFRRDARVRIRAADARSGIAALRADSADAVVLDAYVGARTPAELTTAEFFADVARVLRPAGVLIANLADGGPLAYLRRVLRSVAPSLPHAAIALDPGVRGGRRFGNIVLSASRAPLPIEALRRAAAAAMFPVAVVAGEQLRALAADATPFSDADAMRSPAPPADSWRRGG